jgi:hypothetical protein
VSSANISNNIDAPLNIPAPLSWHQRLLFEPSRPAALGFLRMAFFGYMLWIYWDYQVVRWADVSNVFWMVWSRYDLLGLPPISKPYLLGITFVWKLALLGACLGWRTRWCSGISLVLGVYVLGLPLNYAKISHFPGLLLIATLMFWLSRSNDSWSIDQWQRRRRGGEPHRASGEYTWPIRVVQLAMTLAFLGAGWSKLTGEGWLFTENLKYQFILHHYLEDRSLPAIGLYIAQSDWLCMFLAMMTVAVELLAPLALFNRWARCFLISSLFLMQLGNATILGVHPEFPWLVLYWFWIPWNRVGDWLHKQMTA